MAIKAVPDGFSTVTPYLVTTDANKLIAFITEAFGGEVTFKHEEEGRIRHAEVRIGQSMIMLGQSASAEYPPSPASLYLYTEECDRWHARALAAGATQLSPMEDHDYGDRNGGVKDPLGNSWFIGKRIKAL